MKSVRTRRFKSLYQALPAEVQQQANEAYRLWRNDPYHPSLHFKVIDHKEPKLWSIRIGKQYRALGIEYNDRIEWV